MTKLDAKNSDEIFEALGGELVKQDTVKTAMRCFKKS